MRLVPLLTGTLLALAALAMQSPSRADEPLGTRQNFWRAEVGVRTAFIRDRGLDPFADNDVFMQSSIGASRMAVSIDRFSFAPGLMWDFGARSATARGADSTLAIHRLTATLETRYHVLPWLYGFVRGAPGALHGSARVNDASAPAELHDGFWSFALDVSGGAAALIGPQDEPGASPIRWWAGAEGGYGWTPKHHLVLSPELASDDTRHVGGLDLGELAMRGGYFRIFAAMTY